MNEKSKLNKIFILGIIFLLSGINVAQEINNNADSLISPSRYSAQPSNDLANDKGLISENTIKSPITISNTENILSETYLESPLASTTAVTRIKKYVTCYSSAINTAANQAFVAQHFDMAGMERTLYTAAQNIKTLNSNFKILVYYNAMVQPDWYEDWITINQTKYESWFVHDKYGSNYYHRVRDLDGDHFLMKPNLGLTPNQQYTSWSDYFAKRAITFIQSYPQYDGVFADEVIWNLSALGVFWNVPYSSFESGILPFETYWGPNFLKHMKNVQTTLGSKPIVCNCWKWTTFSENATHMMMWEGFIHRRAHEITEPGYSPEYALFAINTLRSESQKGNTIIVNSGTKNANSYPQTAYKIMKYTLACFLFAVEDMSKSYYSWNFFGQTDDSSRGYYPAMDIEFGNPVGEYYHIKNDVYARNFENKTVVANMNPTTTETVTINGQQYQIGPTTGLFINKTGSSSSWWNANWGYRKKITIDQSKVSANLVNFPVLVSLASDSNLVGHTQSDGDDIVFTDSTGNKLNHEIELFTSSTGRLVAWVNVPSLSSSTDTVLYMYYGNSACSSQQSVQSTWESNYLMVHHMEEAENIYDSTSHGLNAVNYGTTTDSSGKIDGCRYFNSLTDYYSFGNPSSLNPGANSWTITLWTKIVHVDSTYMLRKLDSNAGFMVYLYNGWGGTNYVKVGDGTHTIYRYWNTAWSDGNWHYISIVINRNTNVVDLYLDGVLNNGGGSGSIAGFGSITTSANTYLYGGTNGRHDEFTVSTTVRSASWIKTSYTNQNAPSSFYILGSQETA